jgi:hypothetical protein
MMVRTCYQILWQFAVLVHNEENPHELQTPNSVCCKHTQENSLKIKLTKTKQPIILHNTS